MSIIKVQNFGVGICYIVEWSDIFLILWLLFFIFQWKQKETDLQCLLTKNMIKACKSMFFSVTQSLVKLTPLDADCGFTGFTVGLASALVWAIREARIHNKLTSTLIFNLKLDGRPFAGIFVHIFQFDTLFNFLLWIYYIPVKVFDWERNLF